MSKDRFLIELDDHAIALIDYEPAELETSSIYKRLYWQANNTELNLLKFYRKLTGTHINPSPFSSDDIALP